MLELNTYSAQPSCPTRRSSDLWEKTVEEIEEHENLRELKKQVIATGGLHVLGTERHEAIRIDRQLAGRAGWPRGVRCRGDRKSTRLNSSHLVISYAVFCLKKKT